ncbi:P27 family phage terminase small subunit [Ammoniphilus sp. YIM 78166]|uniref:P27 family phage terminase small subunit n=1 Tax=Ammoniphilus sp. YIM 78166 TaxID=1644106 RepID=UPI00106F7495|nr:P27 family phage terminase small subunit [Ammoniphilus sp. YIM 78166]
MVDEKLKRPPKSLYDREAKKYYLFLIEEYGDKIKPRHQEWIVNLCNLRSQKMELEKEFKENGYTVVNVNSRGGKTFQSNPAYRSYLSAIAEMNKIQSKLEKVGTMDDDEDDDEDDLLD